ncbi:MAG: sugar ABC transporter ATP-binding protein [Verrucomicrobiales bacterium]|nr:sugar ABC transporter ATP-binding protein [Verrucomicrobiales bacterium]
MSPILGFCGITKSFFGVKVLREVSFDVPAGSTVGIVGENGAGKSTLMNILGGNLAADAGQMMFNGQPYAPVAPADAARAGIGFVHQELNLFPNLSIAENLFLNRFPRRSRWWPFVDRRRLFARARALLQEVQLPLSPDTLVERLSAGERQLVEVAKALGSGARLIILDEPTTSLTAFESARLFDLLGRLRHRGIALLYISHNLGDVRQLCDDILVLRDGAVVGRGQPDALSVEKLIALMVGREITGLFPPRPGEPGDQVILEVSGITQPGVVRPIHFQLRAGEILGVSGLMGAGRSELARILFGLDPCAAGTVRLLGQSLSGLSPRQRIARGLAFLTEDRRGDGLSLEGSIGENLTSVMLPRLVRGPSGWLDTGRSREGIRRLREAVSLTSTASDDQAVRTLSGGNQQKVVLAKWLWNEPKVCILDEPTRGIDVGAKYEIYRLIGELAARGAGVLMISSEVEELIGVCDRILVMSRGHIRECVERRDFDRERILRSALHGEAGS